MVDGDDDDVGGGSSFAFDGRSYPSYQEMVDAKRKRNANVLARSGLLEAKRAISSIAAANRRPSSSDSVRGLKRAKVPQGERAPPTRRKSSRIAGIIAPDIRVEHETMGTFIISGNDALSSSSLVEISSSSSERKNYNGRVNDGSDLSISDSVQLADSKWRNEDDVERAEQLFARVFPDAIEDVPIASWRGRRGDGGGGDSPASVVDGPNATMSGRRAGRSTSSPAATRNDDDDSDYDDARAREIRHSIDGLSCDDVECVSKVTPDRIYSITCHPSPNGVIVCAGDKSGHLGVWNVDGYRDGGGGGSSAADKHVSSSSSSSSSSTDDGVHLFKVHSGTISTMAWNGPGSSLLTSSYDGSVRLFDVERGSAFVEVFATYSDDAMYRDKVGYGTDRGYNSWIQGMEIDTRYGGGEKDGGGGGGGVCFFLCTSEGRAMHVDLRSRAKLTFDAILSEKKINTISLHPNGNVMATAGLTGIVQLWDVRKIPTSSSKAKPKPVSWQEAGGRSINAAYFSPSGRRLLTTTMSNRLEIIEDSHLATGKLTTKVSVNHDNQTGRWLSTFMARWHPGCYDNRELFVVGSMKQPRCMEVYDHDGDLLREIRGDAITAVASRCCFHPDPNRLVVIGGNGSGRVTIAR